MSRSPTLDAQLKLGGSKALATLRDAKKVAQTAPRDRVDRLLLSLRAADAVFPPKPWLTTPLRQAVHTTRKEVARTRIERFGLKLKKPKDLLELDDRAVVWAAITLVWDVATIYEGPRALIESLAGATPLQRALYGAWWTEAEVGNGGFHQYFWNSTGVVCALALEGFDAIGAPRLRACLGEALTRLGPGCDVLDRASRQRALAEIRPDAFSDLDAKFYEAEATEFLPRAAKLVRREWIEFFDAPRR